MNIETQIRELCQWSQEELEQSIFLQYLKWCQKHTANPQLLQSLLANAAIGNWYNRELQKLHLQFLRLQVANYTTQQIHSMYYLTVGRIMDLYPAPLIEQVKKTSEDIQQIIYNNLVIFKN